MNAPENDNASVGAEALNNTVTVITENNEINMLVQNTCNHGRTSTTNQLADALVAWRALSTHRQTALRHLETATSDHAHITAAQELLLTKMTCLISGGAR